MVQSITDQKDEILCAALEDVPFDGWAWPVVEKAAIKAGYTKETARALFPHKLKSVLNHFSQCADRQMMTALADYNPDDMRIRDRVEKAVELRFKALLPYKECVREAAGYWANPLHKAEAAKLVWQIADKIWIWAGDTATDYNRYTKRLLLSAVISSTTLYWLNDDSEDMGDTIAFLNRRINNVLQIGKATGKVKSLVSRVKA